MYGLNTLEDEIDFFKNQMLGEDLAFYNNCVKRKKHIGLLEQELVKHIHRAFKGVTCHHTKRVLYASYMHDSFHSEVASNHFYEWLWSQEERDNWGNIPVVTLYACADALAHLEPESFRFLAPAFMCCNLEYEAIANDKEWGCYFSFTANKPDDRWKQGIIANYSLFTTEQRYCMQVWIDYWKLRLNISMPDWCLPWELEVK